MLGKGWAPKFLFCKHLPLHHKQRASSLGLSLSATVLDFHRLLSLVSLPSAMRVVGFLSGEPTAVSLESWSGESDCRMLSTPRPMCKSGRGMERLVYWCSSFTAPVTCFLTVQISPMLNLSFPQLASPLVLSISPPSVTYTRNLRVIPEPVLSLILSVGRQHVHGG